jgi:hypothetical protein
VCLELACVFYARPWMLVVWFVLLSKLWLQTRFCPCLNQEGGCYIWVVQHIKVFVLGGPRPEQCKEIDWVALCAYWSTPKFQALCGHLSTTWAQVKIVSNLDVVGQYNKMFNLQVPCWLMWKHIFGVDQLFVLSMNIVNVDVQCNITWYLNCEPIISASISDWVDTMIFGRNAKWEFSSKANK